MIQEAYMELCLTLEMIWDYFTKEIQGSKFRWFRNIILGIHKDDIPSYHTPVRAFIKDKNIKTDKDNKRLRSLTNYQDTKATNECVGKSYLRNYQWTTDARKKARSGFLYISYAHILHVYSLVPIETTTWALKISVTNLYC